MSLLTQTQKAHHLTNLQNSPSNQNHSSEFKIPNTPLTPSSTPKPKIPAKLQNFTPNSPSKVQTTHPKTRDAVGRYKSRGANQLLGTPLKNPLASRALHLFGGHPYAKLRIVLAGWVVLLRGWVVLHVGCQSQVRVSIYEKAVLFF